MKTIYLIFLSLCPILGISVLMSEDVPVEAEPKSPCVVVCDIKSDQDKIKLAVLSLKKRIRDQSIGKNRSDLRDEALENCEEILNQLEMIQWFLDHPDGK